ncbi:ribonuclease III, partial [Bimuria novae-zelandiae CBS 107.79]
RVVRVEDIIGYKFKNKMIGLQALKTSHDTQPLYWQGIIMPVEKNRRLALVGDRALGLTLCELWWNTKLDNGRYARLSTVLESRKAMEKRALALGLDYPILISDSKRVAVFEDIAETFEAIIGAVYIDSGKDLATVRTAVERLGLE